MVRESAPELSSFDCCRVLMRSGVCCVVVHQSAACPFFFFSITNSTHHTFVNIGYMHIFGRNKILHFSGGSQHPRLAKQDWSEMVFHLLDLLVNVPG